MKTKVFLFFLSFVLFFNGYGQKGTTMKIVKTTNEIGFLLNESDGVFKENYIFQFENETKNSSKPTVETIQYAEHLFDGKNLVISYNDDIYIYTISDKKGDNIFNGYGLAYRKGEFVLNNIEKQESVFDIIAIYDVASLTNKKMTCHSGGEGSSSCSIESPIIGGSCSVTCNNGYYACCNQSKNECKCIVQPADPRVKQKIKVLENPIKGNLTFEFEKGHETEDISNYTIEIFNQIGNLVYKGPLSSNIDFSKQAVGIYISIITGKNGYTQRDKIVKK